MNKNKGFTPILILVVVLIIVAIAGAFYLGKKNGTVNYLPTPTPISYSSPSASPTQNLTINWKTYSGDIYNFKYPENYNLDTNSYVTPYLNGNITWRYNSTSFLSCQGDCPFVESQENTTLGGKPAVKISGYIGSVGGNIPQKYITYEVKLQNKYFVFSIQALTPFLTPNQSLTYDQNTIQPIKSEDLKIFNQILSTFKFTN